MLLCFFLTYQPRLQATPSFLRTSEPLIAAEIVQRVEVDERRFESIRKSQENFKCFVCVGVLKTWGINMQRINLPLS